jgi:pilus assembly protein Flp/PilA
MNGCDKIYERLSTLRAIAIHRTSGDAHPREHRAGMKQRIANFLRDENGAAAIEYALIVSLIGTGLIVSLQELGQTVAGIYLDIGRALDDVLARIK